MLNLIELPIERTIDRSLEDKLIRATKAHAYLAPFLGAGRACTRTGGPSIGTEYGEA